MSKVWQSLNTDTQRIALFGTNLKVKTTLGDQFQGTLFYYDENMVILKNEDEYFMVNQQSIQDLQPVSVQDPKQVMQTLLRNDLEKLVQEVVKNDMKEPHQVLFDHLQKLYRDVEWKGDEITIPSIQIKLVPPYYAENVSGDNKKAVERLKKIVDKFSKS